MEIIKNGTLAWRFPEESHEPYRYSGRERWQSSGLDGKSLRQTISKIGF